MEDENQDTIPNQDYFLNKAKAKAEEYKKTHPDFNISRYLTAVTTCFINGGNPESVTCEDFDKQDENLDFFNLGDGLSFKAGFRDGKFVAKGSNGETIESADHYDFCVKMAQSFKKNQTDPDTLLIVKRTPRGNGMPGIDREQARRDFAKAFINNGVAPDGDIPQDKEFWLQFKDEYLRNENNTPEMWNKLTKHIPDNVMGRQKEHTDNVFDVGKIADLSGRTELGERIYNEIENRYGKEAAENLFKHNPPVKAPFNPNKQPKNPFVMKNNGNNSK